MELGEINQRIHSNNQTNNDSSYEWIKIVGASTLAAVIYGISNDLLQRNDCPEYWGAGHVYGAWTYVNPKEQPIANAIIWGTVGSWWAGAFAGIVMATASRIPLPFSKNKVEARELLKPLAAVGAIGLPLGHLVSMITKSVVAKAIQHGANYASSIPKLHSGFPDLPVERQPDWYACATRNDFGYLLALIALVGLTTSIVYNRYKQQPEKQPVENCLSGPAMLKKSVEPIPDPASASNLSKNK